MSQQVLTIGPYTLGNSVVLLIDLLLLGGWNLKPRYYPLHILNIFQNTGEVVKCESGLCVGHTCCQCEHQISVMNKCTATYFMIYITAGYVMSHDHKHISAFQYIYIHMPHPCTCMCTWYSLDIFLSSCQSTLLLQEVKLSSKEAPRCIW